MSDTTTGKFIAACSSHTGCIYAERTDGGDFRYIDPVYFHSGEFEAFQQRADVVSIEYEDSENEISIGETYKGANVAWYYRKKTLGGSIDVALPDRIINIDMVAYYYEHQMWFMCAPEPLVVNTGDRYRTNRLSAVSSIEYFDPAMIDHILDEYYAVTPDVRVRFIGMNRTVENIGELQDDDYECIIDRTPPNMEYRITRYYVESEHPIDRIKVYRLVNLLGSSGWNDEDGRFKKLLAENKGNLFCSSEQQVCKGLER
jgi:hypothetical protein